MANNGTGFLSGMNSAQHAAAIWNDGPALVLAGPGSGKTRVLTCRIARILENSRDDKFRILGLTFTNKAADEMRSRVAQLVPGLENRLFLGTFHSFCGDVLRQHGNHLGISPNFEIYSQTADLELLLAEAVERVKPLSSLISDNDKKTLPVIHFLKGQLIFPDNCGNALKDPVMNKRMSVVYPEYEKVLQERNAVDFPSLIMRTYELFNKYPAFARRYRDVYSFVCVDEFQDTNEAQYQLLRAILGEGKPNLFIVADDDQIIYQWNGASHQRIKQLISDYGPHVIQLPLNYRCPSEIVDLANNLIRNNFSRTDGKSPLESFQGAGGDGTVRLLAFDNSEDESNGVADDIARNHQHELGSVVGIARNRKLLLGLERALRLKGIPVCIAQRKDEFQSTALIWVHSILRLANERRSKRFLAAVSGSLFQLTGEKVDEDEVAAEADASHQDYLRQWIKQALKSASSDFCKTIISFASKELVQANDFLAFAESVCDCVDAEVTKMSLPSDDGELFREEWQVWNELRRDIGSALGDELTLEAFLQELQMRSKEAMPSGNLVLLYTIHASKGKEFDHVYVIGSVEDELPSFQSKKKGDKSPEMEEERRNCFVAITRASRTLTLSYAKRYNGYAKEPSRFLFEMGVLKPRFKKP